MDCCNEHQHNEITNNKHASHNSAEHEDHDKHAGHSPEMFKRKFWLSFLLTIPVLFFSPTIQELIGYSAPSFTFDQYLPALFGVIIFLYGGLVFLKGAKSELSRRQPGMMTLISLAISVAFTYSLLITASLVNGMDFWWELSTLVTIMLLGHWLEMASVKSAQGALKELAKLLPDETELVISSGTKTVAVSALVVGNEVLIRPGARIPVDGLVINGKSQVNEAMLTGESKLIEKVGGSEVIGGTVNGSGSLTVKVTRVGGDTALAGIMKLVAEAQSSKSSSQLLADKAAYYLTFIAIAAALATALGWSLLGSASGGFILERVVTVLVIACPHALGLAVPLVTAISTTKAARSGLLVRKRAALEESRLIDVVLFDKTGTLTMGKQGVVGLIADNEDDLLAIASSIEADSEHPIARAIVAESEKRHIKAKVTRDFSALEGRGAKAVVDGALYYIGGPQMLRELDAKITSKFTEGARSANDSGQTVVYVVREKQILGAILIADVIRSESKEAVQELQKAGKRVAMLTGDSEGVAKWVSGELGLDEFYAEVLPQHKSDVVKKLQSDGSRVAMVGDGVNDAPALTQANIGIAIGAGTDVAIESASIVLASSDPRGVTRVIKLSRRTYIKMVQNLAWATGYNAVAIPLASGLTASLGFVLSPALGAVLMSLSTIIVALNAQLLRRVKL